MKITWRKTNKENFLTQKFLGIVNKKEVFEIFTYDDGRALLFVNQLSNLFKDIRTAKKAARNIVNQISN